MTAAEPHTIPFEAVKNALRTLGITDLDHIVDDQEGRIITAGAEVATVTTIIGYDW